MLASAEDIEQLANQIGPISLLILGIGGVLLGLFFWLGGIRFKRILLPATGLMAGGIIGFLAFSRGAVIILISVIFCVILGIILEIISERILSRKAFLSRAAVAVLFSAAGTAIIFAGMIALLIFKGADPLGELERRSGFYAAVFAGMVIFGTVIQSILGGRRERGLENAQRKE